MACTSVLLLPSAYILFAVRFFAGSCLPDRSDGLCVCVIPLPLLKWAAKIVQIASLPSLNSSVYQVSGTGNYLFNISSGYQVEVGFRVLVHLDILPLQLRACCCWYAHPAVPLSLFLLAAHASVNWALLTSRQLFLAGLKVSGRGQRHVGSE